MKSIYAGLFLIVACCFSVFATTLDSSDWFGFGGSLGTGGVWSSGSLVENPEALKNIKKSESWIKNALENEDILLSEIFYAFYKNKKLYIIKKGS